jgi:hypothetical protein
MKNIYDERLRDLTVLVSCLVQPPQRPISDPRPVIVTCDK